VPAQGRPAAGGRSIGPRPGVTTQEDHERITRGPRRITRGPFSTKSTSAARFFPTAPGGRASPQTLTSEGFWSRVGCFQSSFREAERLNPGGVGRAHLRLIFSSNKKEKIGPPKWRRPTHRFRRFCFPERMIWNAAHAGPNSFRSEVAGTATPSRGVGKKRAAEVLLVGKRGPSGDPRWSLS